MSNWADKLIHEYTIGRSELVKHRDRLDKDDPLDRDDIKAINSMIDDMSFALEWMTKGRRPGNYRGADRRSAYQRRTLLDMDLFPSIDLKPKQVYLSDEQKQQLVEILVEFSHRERQCYLMHMAHGMSLSEIAEELCLAKSTIQKYVDRAKDKVNLKISCHTVVV